MPPQYLCIRELRQCYFSSLILEKSYHLGTWSVYNNLRVPFIFSSSKAMYHNEPTLSSSLLLFVEIQVLSHSQLGWYGLASACLFSLISITFLLGHYLPPKRLPALSSPHSVSSCLWARHWYFFLPGMPFSLVLAVAGSFFSVKCYSEQPPWVILSKGTSSMLCFLFPFLSHHHTHFLQNTPITACKYFVDSWIDSPSPALEMPLWEGRGLVCYSHCIPNP